MITEGYADSISGRVKEGIPVELIVPLHVAEELKRSPYLEKIQVLKAYENFKLMVMDVDIKVGLIVTDKRLSLGLYKKAALNTISVQACSVLTRRSLNGERGFSGIVKGRQT